MSDAVFDPQACGSVLVIKLRHLGDVLLTSPVFSAIKAYCPQAQIDALVYADTCPMLEGHPDVREVLCIDRQWKKAGVWQQMREELALLRTLRARRYDLVIHLTEHPRGAWLTRILKPRWAVGMRHRKMTDFWRKSFTHLILPAGHEARHTVEKHLDALRVLGIHPAPDRRGMRFVPGVEAERTVAAELGRVGFEHRPFIVLHPASRWKFKCTSEAMLEALIDEVGRQGIGIVLTAGNDPDEISAVRRLEAGKSAWVTGALAGKLSLKQLGALIARARAFVGVDSAPMHMAAALGTPTVALFGPTNSKNWSPWGVSNRVVASTTHSCVPCGADGCAGSKISDCLMQLDVQTVSRALFELLDEAGVSSAGMEAG